MSEAERDLDEAKAEAVRSWFEGRPRAPFSIEVSPTMACNENCLFCRRKDQLAGYYAVERDLSDDRWLEVLTEAVARGTRRLLFRGGGEPGLKRSLLRRLLPLIEEKRVHCAILTNGTLFDETLAEAFVRAAWAEVIVSLHGPDAATHDAIVDQPGAFARVERSLELLGRYKRELCRHAPQLSFHVVLTRVSFRRIDEIVALARKHGVGHVGVFPMHNATDPRFIRDLEMRPEDIREYRELVPKYRRMLEGFGLGHDFQLSYQGEGPDAPPEPSSVPAREGPLPIQEIPCYYPWFHAALTPNGYVSPCCYGEGNQVLADLHRVGFDEAWNGHDMEEARRAMRDGRMMPYCRNCPNWYQGDNRRIREALRRKL